MNGRRVISKQRIVLMAGLLFLICSTIASAQRHRSTVQPRSRGTIMIHQLPHTHVTVNHSGVRFFYSNGVFYRRHPRGYVVVRPMIGLRVRSLPFGFTTLYFGAVPYYYYYGSYYTFDPRTREYVVCEKPNRAGTSDRKLDQVSLIDGNILEGIYLKSDGKIVEFEVGGKVREIPIQKIVTIQFAPSDGNADSTEPPVPEQHEK
jgi:hypothetical protein